MAKPIFAVTEPGFMGFGDPNIHTKKYEGDKSLFGRVKRFYVHGELEGLVGFDIADFIAGDFLDLPLQDAAIVNPSGELIEAVIVMVTATNTQEKFALLVCNTEKEIERAKKYLWDGEWLENGKSRRDY